MAKEFNVPPVNLASGEMAGTVPHQRPLLSAPPFQAPRSPAYPNLPFMSFDMGSATASTSFSAPILAGNSLKPGTGGGFEDELPLLEELGINTCQIWRKMLSILNPIRINANLHEDADLSGQLPLPGQANLKCQVKFKASMAPLTDDCSEGKGVGEEDEEDDDLFEIDLDVVNSIPTPQFWEGYLTKTGSVLLANCLLPPAVVSKAVPADSSRGKIVKEVS